MFNTHCNDIIRFRINDLGGILKLADYRPFANPINGAVDTLSGATYGIGVIYSCDTGNNLMGNSQIKYKPVEIERPHQPASSA